MAEPSSKNVPVQIYFMDDESLSVRCDDKGSSVDGTHFDCDDNIGDGLHVSPDGDLKFFEPEEMKKVNVSGSNKWNCVGRDAAIILTCFPSMLWNFDGKAEVITSAEKFPEILIHCSDDEEKLNELKSLALNVKTKAIKLETEAFTQLKNTLSKNEQLFELKFYWMKPEKTMYIFGHSDEELQSATSKVRKFFSESAPVKKAGRVFASSFEEDSFTGIPLKVRASEAASSAFQFQTDGGLNVKVYPANITTLDVDVIVNAANKELQHGGGVARAIAEAAGQQLESECRTYINRRGYLKVGENMVTSGGKLPSDKVIHALGPIWRDYTDKSRCLKDLYEAVEGTLNRCKELKCRTVAMPIISAGVYGVPKDKCAQVYIKAIEDHSSANGATPRELHIVDINDDVIEYMQTAQNEFLQGDLNPFRVPVSFTDSNREWKDTSNIYSRSASSSSSRGDSRRFATDNDDTNWQNNGFSQHRSLTKSASSGSSVSDSRTYAKVAASSRNSDFSRGYTGLKEIKRPYLAGSTFVHVAVGDLVHAHVDCIMCACDINPSYAGQLVKAVRNAGGSDFQKMHDIITQKNYVKAGDIYCIPGRIGELKCDCVMFLIVDDSKYRNNLKKYIKSMFEKVRQKPLQSIALPILRADALSDTEKREFIKIVLHEAGKHRIPSSVYLVCKDYDWSMKTLLQETVPGSDKPTYY